ncbi:MAG: hypothetical protein Q8P59_02455 [Dehalococcoidia bacterium]|nr:hypothetical protein [Dehalococcoidia bacterium]
MILAWNEETEARWRKLTDEVMTGVREWRVQHPKATLEEIEAAIDEGLAKVRARMLEDVALASAAAEVSKSEEEMPSCPECGHKMETQGQRERSVITSYDQAIRLKRSYARCPACGAGFFPPG